MPTKGEMRKYQQKNKKKKKRVGGRGFQSFLLYQLPTVQEDKIGNFKLSSFFKYSSPRAPPLYYFC